MKMNHKIILWMCILLSLAFAVSGALSDGIQFFVNCDGDINDITGQRNFTSYTTVVYSSQPGTFRGTSACWFSGATNGHYTTPSTVNIARADVNFTICDWMKPNGTGYRAPVGKTVNGGNNEGWYTVIYDTTNYMDYGSDGNGVGDGSTSMYNVDMNNKWVHMCTIYDFPNKKAYLYLNGTNVANGTTAPNSFANTVQLDIGCMRQTSIETCNVNPYQGILDDIGYWNRSLTQSEITTLFTSGYSGASSDNFAVAQSLYNDTTSLGVTSAFDQLFYIRANYTNNGVTVGNGSVCKVNSTNMSLTIRDSRTANFSITTTSNYELNFSGNKSSTSYMYDTYNFRICHIGASNNAQVYINNALFKTIPSTEISSCTAGFASQFNLSDNFIGFKTFNLSVRCSGCNPTQTLRVVPLANGFIGEISRTLGVYNDTLDFNGTWYVDNAHWHSFSVPNRINYVSVNCNNTNQTVGYTTGSVPVQARLVEITDINGVHAFEAGLRIELSNLSIIGNCRNQPLSAVNINITYPNNNTVILSNDSEFLYIPESLLGNQGSYNLSLWCKDIYGNTSYAGWMVNINDSVIPSWTWYSPSPLNNTIVAVGGQLGISGVASDEHLYKVVVNCYDVLNINTFSQIVTDIPVSSLAVINISNTHNFAGASYCNVTVQDGHTSQSIQNILKSGDSFDSLDYHTDSGSLNISINGMTNSGFYKEMKKDRIVFAPILKDNPDTLSYRLSCSEDLVYMNPIKKNINDYNAWFLCSDMWIDYNMKGLLSSDYSVKKIFGNEYQIDINVKKLKDKNGILGPSVLSTNSIGIINTITDKVYYTVAVNSTSGGSTTVNLDTTPFILLAFIILWLGVLIVGIMMGKLGGILWMTDAIFGIFFAFYLMNNLSDVETISIIIIMINLLIFIFGAGFVAYRE